MNNPNPTDTPAFNALTDDPDHPLQPFDSIQAHGILLAFDAIRLTVRHVSANVTDRLGLEPSQLLGRSLDEILGEDQGATVKHYVSTLSNPPESNSTVQFHAFKLWLDTPSGSTCFDSFVHQSGTAIILELEPAAIASQDIGATHHLIRPFIEDIKRTQSRAELLQLVVERIRHLTGYDRVLIYEFEAAGSGLVTAESKVSELPTYLGLHFPARDIPPVIRTLYIQNKLRTVPHLQRPSVPLVPPIDAAMDDALDLSQSVLRGVDPCCVEYYSNMGMQATMVAALTHEQTLWGLLSCHHSTPKHLPYDTRALCDILARIVTLEIASKVSQEDRDERAKRHQLRTTLIASIAQADNMLDALVIPETRLLDLVQASGAAICLGQNLTLVGNTPDLDDVRALIEWTDQHIQEDVFHTHCLSDVYAPSAPFKAIASGLFLLRISRIQHYLILWFRPEVVQTVDWGGDPHDGITQTEAGEVVLSPRRSFERWREMVYASSLPWSPMDVDGVTELRNAIVGIVLKKAEELTRLNHALSQSNRELASFAYAAAHDLKEPVRGIYNYASIVQEDYGDRLDEDGLDYLSDIQEFSKRMETLINALLRISQLRQAPLHPRWVNLNDVLAEAVSVVRASWADTTFSVQVARSLPSVYCDPVLVNEVFRNLISNAIKYNDTPQKRIEVGYQATSSVDHMPPMTDARIRPSRWVFYVRDNGIGIRHEHLSIVFKLFKRLHPQDYYGGGAGVGLAVVNQIIERHGGQIWIDSTLQQGSTFFFTLGHGDNGPE